MLDLSDTALNGRRRWELYTTAATTAILTVSTYTLIGHDCCSRDPYRCYERQVTSMDNIVTYQEQYHR
jgi:hypothetical protein